MDQTTPFVLFACCLPVKGRSRSIICDLQRQKIHFIPNILYDILIDCSGKSIEDIKAKYDYGYNDHIEEYFNFLIKEEFVFFDSSPENFPKLILDWKHPSTITNAIWDVNIDYIGFSEKIAQQLDVLGCKHLQMRFLLTSPSDRIEYLMHSFEGKRIENIELILAYQDNYFNKDAFVDFMKRWTRISSVFLYGAPCDELAYKAPYDDGYIHYITENITTNKFCGKIYPKNFYTNISTFTESLHHNSCLNRKISIDVDGNIKNCPSMSQSFGNIKDTTLQEALDHPEFKKYWNVTKDQIEVCKDCEFRYICTDCRGYIENPEDMYSKPLKCGYNPYTCEWEEWSTNPLKQKAIDYYGMREVLPEFKMKPDYAPASHPGPA